MKIHACLRPLLTLGALLLSGIVGMGQPQVLSLSPSGGRPLTNFVTRSVIPRAQLVWTNPIAGGYSVIETAPDPTSGLWERVHYEVGTTGLISSAIPVPAGNQGYYRVSILTNAPDPSLLMHLSFENAFDGGTVVDSSGFGNHGRRYGRPGNQTNWPSVLKGPDGGQAAEFHEYWDGYGRYGRSGDYIGIPTVPMFENMREATVCIWTRYYRAPDGDINNDHNATLLYSGRDTPGTWVLGREYSDTTSLIINLSVTTGIQPIVYPDKAPDGDTKDWHYYSFTFKDGFIKAYFDGRPFKTAQVPVPALTVAGYYIGIACWTFNATPEMDLSVDENPNNAWINGAVDDVRIYNRELTEAEMLTLYQSFNKVPPTGPADVTASANSSSQVILQWSQGYDLFGVERYVISRNGIDIATNQEPSRAFFDTAVEPNSTYTYSVRAVDPSGLESVPTSATAVTTPTAGSEVSVIVDNGFGEPWVVQEGGVWYPFATLPGFIGKDFLSDEKIGKGKSVVFRPNLPEPGLYQVFVRYPGRNDISFVFANSVPIDITHNGETNTVTISEQGGYGTWKSLGSYNFTAGTNDFVRLRTDGTTGYVVADAFLFKK